MSAGKQSMMLCAGLEPAEQEKVERLDRPISVRFNRAGLVVRICQGSGDSEHRVLNFCDPNRSTVASIPAREFLAASDEDAVAKIVLPS